MNAAIATAPVDARQEFQADVPPPTENGRVPSELLAAIRADSAVLKPRLFGVVAAWLAYLFVVVIHELGHYITAKLTGVKVLEAGLGYPPRIWGFTWRGTLYSINWLPLGGFVRITVGTAHIYVRDGTNAAAIADLSITGIGQPHYFQLSGTWPATCYSGLVRAFEKAACSASRRSLGTPGGPTTTR